MLVIYLMLHETFGGSAWTVLELCPSSYKPHLSAHRINLWEKAVLKEKVIAITKPNRTALLHLYNVPWFSLVM